MKLFLWSKDKIQHMIDKKNMLQSQPNLKPIFLKYPFLALDWLVPNLMGLLHLDFNMSKIRRSGFFGMLVFNQIKININGLSCFIGFDDFQKGKVYTSLSGSLGKSLQFNVSKRLLNS